MSAVSLVWLGLCAVLMQSVAVMVARHFLEVHHERPLSAIGRMVMVTRVIFTGLSFLSALLSPSALQGLFSLVFLAFLSLFIYLDAASRCLPRCFTLAFGVTGAVFRFLLSPESGLPALVTALSVFGVLWALRTLSYRRDERTQLGLGDVYLMAGLGMWFSFPAVVWVISASAVQGVFFCWQEEHAIRVSGRKTSMIVLHPLPPFYVSWQRWHMSDRWEVIFRRSPLEKNHREKKARNPSRICLSGNHGGVGGGGHGGIVWCREIQ